MFQVEPREEECMYQSIEAGSQVRADLTIVRGGKLDARLKIDAPSAGRLFEKLLLSNIDDVTGNIVDTLIKKGHSFTAPSTGNYAFCIDNTMSRWTAKVVDFDLAISAPATEPGKPKTVGSMAQSTANMHALMDSTETIQRFLKVREHRHRETAESTCDRIAWYTVAETLVVVSLSVAQIVIVRRWFQGSRGLPGGLR